jgi:hypothetical protein
MPVGDVLPIARQIANALEAAHEQGIVHRDLKPANIKGKADGTVKVLDFSLAKALTPEGTRHTAGHPAGAHAAAPQTMTTPAETRAGIILGTVAYMSPEQARGGPVDRRADIWAFGVVLFERLTGRRTFGGDTVSDTLAAVLTRDPDWSALPAATPPAVRRLLERCLDKDARKRLRDIGDARFDLDGRGDVGGPVAQVSPAATGSRWRRAVPWTVALVGLLVAAWATVARPGVPAAAGAVTHIDIPYPRGVEPVSSQHGGFAVSPDGRTVAMVGVRDGARQVFVRRLDRPDAYELPDTAGVNWLSFSPDGGSLAFMPASGTIVRMSLVDQQRRVLRARRSPPGA